MKLTFTLAIFSVFINAVQSQQLQQGSAMLGGTLSFTTLKNTNGWENDVKQTFLSINPTFGKFYRDNRAAGLNLSFGRQKYDDGSLDYNRYGLGLFLRQYLPLGKSFFLFAEEGMSYARSRTKQGQQSQQYRYELTQNSFALNFYPGIAYAITRKLQVELSLYNLVYATYSAEKKRNRYTNGLPDKDISGHYFSFSSGLAETNVGSLGVGARWFLQ